MPKVKIFINPAGQRDNIGDSLLRRPYLDALREAGELHVLAGRNDDYNSGLRLKESDVTYVSSRRWLTHCLLNVAVGRAALAFNAGEYVGAEDERKKSWWQSVLIRAAGIANVPVVVTGASVRPGTAPERTRLGQIARAASFVTWRDDAARSVFRKGSSQPDWAFAAGSDAVAPFAQRTRFALSLRGDRPLLSAQTIDDIRSYAADLGLELWVVVQVKRDSEMATQLAEALGARIFAWPADHDHAQHEDALRRFYQSCRVTLSDRIHVLIVAATEGSLPIGLATSGFEKLRRTFAHVTHLPIVDSADASGLTKVAVDEGSAERLREDLKQARKSLVETSSALAHAIQKDARNDYRS